MKRFWNGYFISNGALVALYVIFRYFVSKPSGLLAPDDFLPKSLAYDREVQVLTTGTVVVCAKYLKSPTWEMFLMHFFFFYKSCFVILLYFSNVWAMFWYLNLCLTSWMIFKNQIFISPNHFTDILSITQLEEEVLKGTNAWLILFYSEINTECIGTMSLWSQMSLNFTTKSLKFGKVCIDSSQFLAKKCAIDTSAYSKQLPTLVLYSNGKEQKRFPPVGPNGEVGMIVNYKVKEIIKYLGLDRIHLATRDS